MYTLSCHVHLFGTKGDGINKLLASLKETLQQEKINHLDK